MRVNSIGVLIEGAPGSGKSALALELVSRGHRLIADDAVEIRRKDAHLIGICPPLLSGFIEVRGLGVLDIRRLFHTTRILQRARIELVVILRRPPTLLRTERAKVRRSGVSLPALYTPPALGHNPAVLIETACRDLWLRRAGFDATPFLARRKLKRILRHR